MTRIEDPESGKVTPAALISANEAKALLDAASSTVWLGGCNAATGEWDVAACYRDHDHPDSFIGVPLTPKGIEEGHAHLIAAAPDLAATVIELYGRLDTVEAERDKLARWKGEAMTVLAGWNQLWEDACRPGALGESVSAATAKHIKALESRCVAAERDAREWVCVAVERTDHRDALQAAIDKVLAIIAEPFIPSDQIVPGQHLADTNNQRIYKALTQGGEPK